MTGASLWTVIVVLGVGTFLIRYSFLGLLGRRALSPWVLRHLRYTGVAVLPGLVAPMAIWPAATDGETDPVRLLAAVAVVAAGLWTRNVLIAMGAGAAVLWGLLGAQALL